MASTRNPDRRTPRVKRVRAFHYGSRKATLKGQIGSLRLPPRNSIQRVLRGKHFEYSYANTNKKITSPVEIKRINAIRVAPGYHDVVICPSATSKVQAWGYDDKGRKQVMYSKTFIEAQKAQKFADLANFDVTYRKIIKDVDGALSGKVRDPKGHIVRLIVRLCILCHLRIGNDKYAKENQSYGLTTLLNKHVTLQNGRAVFDFVGKKSIRNVATCSEPEVIKILAMLKRGKKPNDRLFSFIDKEGTERTVDSSAVNDYLKTFDPNITSKDIRTYEANRLFVDAIRKAEKATQPDTDAAWKSIIRESIKVVADRLHHTPAVCKSAYISGELLSVLEGRGF